MTSEKIGFRFENTYTRLPAAFYKVNPTAEFASPQLVLLNHDLADSMGLDFSNTREEEQVQLFCGNLIPNGTQPFSQAYAGHQFGNFTMLGDGRAHMLGEHLTPKGERFDIQFKGSGRTPFSRGGDGLAALGPMLREYIISEAMHGLGIPTTRSLAVVATGGNVRREQLRPGAVLTRVASSHIRVGTFEYAAATQEPKLLQAILDYTATRHFPKIQESNNKALSLIEAVMERQIQLIVHWMRVGFIHGVMNTDNMALAGESIDFGPCAFMDAYQPDQVFSSIDQHGRYAYNNQPEIALWNLARLAESLLPLIDKDQTKAVENAKELLSGYETNFQKEWLEMMRQKLGLLGEEENDEKLISDLLEWMHRNEADFTNTFKDLSHASSPSGGKYDQDEFRKWYARYETRRLDNGQSFKKSINHMQSVNPSIIPRNHLVEQALEEAEAGDLSFLHELLEVLKKPYQYAGADERFQKPSSSDKLYQTFCGT